MKEECKSWCFPYVKKSSAKNLHLAKNSNITVHSRDKTRKTINRQREIESESRKESPGSDLAGLTPVSQVGAAEVGPAVLDGGSAASVCHSYLGGSAHSSAAAAGKWRGWLTLTPGRSIKC